MADVPGSEGGDLPEGGEGQGRITGKRFARLQEVAVDLFLVSLGTYALLATAETIDRGWVSNFFNLDILLIVVLSSGAAALLPPFYPAWPPASRYGRRSFLAWALGLGALGWVLTWRTTRGLGVLSLMISLASAAIIILVCWLLDPGEAGS